MMDNENEFMIVCVYYFSCFFRGAGCSNEWKERGEVGIKKNMKHCSGSAHK